ncbi:MAG: exopolysaccharide biosynthesis protein EpsL [Telluria sp.]|nr:exopolysaccharide biosynthesis protein EpsL [Telluria sp.]
MSNFTLAPCAIPIAVILAAIAMPAGAGQSDALHAYAGIGYFHDDNLFRLNDDNRLSDSAKYAIGGLYFDKTYGRQKIYLQGKVSKVKFSRFQQLDYDGKDFLGSWDWQLGERFSGKVGASYEQTLAPYTDFRSTERNLRVHKRRHGDANWQLHPSYRVRAGASKDTYTYALPVQRFNNRDEDAVEAGFDFTPRSGSTAGLVARRVKGKYHSTRVVGGSPMNDDFTQDELKAKVNWKVTGISTIAVLAGYARRKHDVNGPRDAKGFNGRVTASLNPRKKLRVNLSAWREFAPIESNIVTYSLNRGVSMGASWDASAKVRLDGNLSRERRGYEGRLAANAPLDLKDNLRQASLSATWSPRPTVQLSTSFAHQRRGGADFLGNGSFKANTVSVNANAQF